MRTPTRGRGYYERINLAVSMLQGLALIVGVILVIDALGFILWILSGQQPVDSFYIGSITNGIIQNLIK